MPLLNNILSCRFPCVRFGSHESDSDEILPRETHEEAVIVNVYDMQKSFNEYTHTFGFGIFHSGVEIYGTEYGFGGHPFASTGIYKIKPRNIEELEEYLGKTSDVCLRESIVIGYTTLSEKEVRKTVRKLGKKFKGNKYHLLSNNCNHFSSFLTKSLCKKDIPTWVNRLANFGNVVPFLERWIPKELISPPIFKHADLIDYHNIIEIHKTNKKAKQKEVIEKEERGKNYMNYYHNVSNRRSRNLSAGYYCSHHHHH